MTAVEFRKAKAAKVSEARAVYDRIKGEGREPTPDEATQVDGLLAEADAFEAKAVGAEQWSMIDARLAEMGKSAGRTADPLPHEDPLNTKNGKHQYSMLKAFREACGAPQGDKLSGIEKEVHQELSKSYNRTSRRGVSGIMVPTTLSVDAYAAARWARASGVRNPHPRGGGTRSTRGPGPARSRPSSTRR